MNLSAQQQPARNLQAVVFSAATPGNIVANAENSAPSIAASISGTPVSDIQRVAARNPLALLEARMNAMANTIHTLNKKVTSLRHTITERDEYIVILEEQSSGLEQQLATSSADHKEMLDGVMGILQRFPEGEVGDDEASESNANLLHETIGTA